MIVNNINKGYIAGGVRRDSGRFLTDSWRILDGFFDGFLMVVEQFRRISWTRRAAVTLWWPRGQIHRCAARPRVTRHRWLRGGGKTDAPSTITVSLTFHSRHCHFDYGLIPAIHFSGRWFIVIVSEEQQKEKWDCAKEWNWSHFIHLVHYFLSSMRVIYWDDQVRLVSIYHSKSVWNPVDPNPECDL